MHPRRELDIIQNDIVESIQDNMRSSLHKTQQISNIIEQSNQNDDQEEQQLIVKQVHSRSESIEPNIVETEDQAAHDS